MTSPSGCYLLTIIFIEPDSAFTMIKKIFRSYLFTPAEKSADSCVFLFQRDSPRRPFRVDPSFQFCVETGIDDLHVKLIIVPTEITVGVTECVREILFQFPSPSVVHKVILTFSHLFGQSSDIDAMCLVKSLYMGVPIINDPEASRLCPRRGVTGANGQLAKPLKLASPEPMNLNVGVAPLPDSINGIPEVIDVGTLTRPEGEPVIFPRFDIIFDLIIEKIVHYRDWS